MRLVCLVVLALVVPASVEASIRINEIAWMGTMESHTDEWIELYNTADNDVDVSGWTLRAADDSPSITLTGAVPAGGFFLLERSDDSTVPGVSADMVYTGALSNAGEQLVVRDGSGAVIDEADGRDGWGIGGDNETKETAQRTDTGWVTAAPTPKTQTASAPAETQEENGSPEQDISAGAPEGALGEDEDRLSISARIQTADTVAVVGAPISLEGVAYGFQGEPIDRGARFLWKFGDGTRAEGRRVRHTYRYPGTYAVYLIASAGRYTASAQANIRAIPADVSISASGSRNGFYIAVENRTAHQLNLGRWILQSESTRFSIPPDTFVLPRHTIRFPSEVVRVPYPADVSSGLALLYPNGEVAATPAPGGYAEQSLFRQVPVSGVQRKVRTSERAAGKPSGAVRNVASVEQSSEALPTSTSVAAPVRYATQAEGESGFFKWLSGAIGLVSAAVVGFLVVQYNRNAADAFEVIEDISPHQTKDGPLQDFSTNKSTETKGTKVEKFVDKQG